MRDKQFKIGDPVKWSDKLDPKRKEEIIEDLGPGPFEIYKTEMRGPKQFVTLSCRSGKKMMVLEDRDQLLFPVDDPMAANIPARIPASILQKISPHPRV